MLSSAERRDADNHGMNATRTHGKTLCTTCRSDDLLSVSMNMNDGGVRFWTCAICETTGWERDGATIPRDVALAAIPRR